MKFRRIVFTGDFLRPSWDGAAPTQHYNIQWCRDLLGNQLEVATGLPTGMVAWNHGGVVSGQLDGAAVSAIYARLGLPRTISAWADIYDERNLPDAICVYFAELFSESLVVAFELPPYLESVLVKCNIPYVDLIVHPVRFLDDIFFAMRSSHGEINAFLAQHAISEEYVRVVAGLQAATARRGANFSPEPGSALLLLQTRFDRTQIRQGKFIGAIDYLDEISDISKSASVLYVKDHPLDKNTPHALAVRTAFDNVIPIGRNFYSLVSCENIELVSTLSSSTGIEAEYFGRKSKFLYKKPNEFALSGGVPQGEEFVGVLSAFLNPDFWREALVPILPTSSLSGVEIPFKNNRLRTSLKSFWGFNEIDTDIATRLAA